jgi:AcrR family transcriptional regulator
VSFSPLKFGQVYRILVMQPNPAPTFIESARREQIVGAAIDILAAEGFARMTFTRIANRAGISPGLITYHFKTKDELIKAVRRTLGQRLDRAMASQAAGAPSYLDAVQMMIIGFVRHCADDPHDMLALQQLELVAGASPEGLKHVEIQRSRDVAELQTILREGKEEGEFWDFDSRTMAASILAAMAVVPLELRARPNVDAAAFGQRLALIVAHAVADTSKAEVRRRLHALG